MAVEATAYRYERRPMWSWIWQTVEPPTHCEMPMQLVSYYAVVLEPPGYRLKFMCDACRTEEWVYTLETPEFVQRT